jgi:DNA-binding response OmpR family regulator
VGAGKTQEDNALRRILDVEDEVLVRLGIAEHLRDCGYEVIEASNAAEARETLLARADVHLMFTDVQMPGDSDGLDLVQWVRVTRPDVKIIVTSGLPDSNRRAAALCAEARFFGKPYQVEAVEARIREMLTTA